MELKYAIEDLTDYIREHKKQAAMGIAAIIILIGIIFLLNPAKSGQQFELTIKDTSGNSLEGIELSYTINGIENTGTTDSEGKILIFAEKGATISVSISRQTVNETEYAEQNQSFSTEETITGEITLKTTDEETAGTTIIFQGPNSKTITGKQLSIRLSCANGYKLGSETVTDTSKQGRITVIKPKGCDVLSAMLLDSSEFNPATITIDGLTKIMHLTPITSEVPKARINVKITDEENKKIKTTNFAVQLINSNNKITAQKMSREISEVLFNDVDLGEYTVTALDTEGKYAAERKKISVTTASLEQEITLKMQSKPKGKIFVTVKDKRNKEIENAKVMLLDSEGNLLGQQITTGTENEKMAFSVQEETGYEISVFNENYLWFETEAKNGDTINAKLEEKTSGNSGTLIVKVIDEGSIAAENAKVILKKENGRPTPYSEQSTNAGGNATFTGIKEGTYYASAEKQGAIGDSRNSPSEIIAGEEANATITLAQGNATIKVSLSTKENEAIPEVTIQAYENSRLLQEKTTTNATEEIREKAGKNVYLTIKSTGYKTIQTEAKTLITGQTAEYSAVLEKEETETIIAEPQVTLDGIYENSQKAATIIAGKTYRARFKITVPNGSEYKKAGFHFRIGNETNVLNESVAIKQAIFPNATMITKGTTYTPPNGNEGDIGSDNGGEAKWIEITFNPTPKQYFFEIEFKVKKTATANSKITMHYRAWFVDSEDKWKRIPADSQLGNNETSASKNTLYANTTDFEATEGASTECLEDFCYANEFIIDYSNGEIQRNYYTMKVNSNYSLEFNIKSNFEETKKLFLTVKTNTSEGIMFKEIKTTGNTGDKNIPINKDTANAKEIASLATGSSIAVSIPFLAKKDSVFYIGLEISDGTTEIFSKNIFVNMEQGKTITITTSPEKIKPLTQTEITAKASSGGNSILGETDITMKKILEDSSQTSEAKKTNPQGEAAFTIPASAPGTIITFEAEKQGYYTGTLRKEVEKDLLIAKENKFNIALDNVFKREATIETDITNNTGTNLEIESAQINGDFKGAIDTRAVRDFLDSLKGKTFFAGETKKTQLLRIQISRNLTITEETDINAELLLTIRDKQTGFTGEKTISLNIKISPVRSVSSGCLKISNSQWKGYTKNNQAEFNIEIEGGCAAGSSTAMLSRILAKAEWEGESLGIIEISKQDNETAETVGEKEFGTVMRNVQFGKTIKAKLLFTPKNETIGKTAKFKIIFDGEVETEQGFTKTGELSMNGEIKILNLGQCIRIPEEKLEIKKEATNAKFTIDSSRCQAPVEIAICRNDIGCKGNAGEGNIIMSSNSIMLLENNPQTQITITKATIPGIYGATIEARTKESDWEYIKTIDVFIEPQTQQIFGIDKYEFSIIGTETKDSATITNPNLAQDIEVIAPVEAWEASTKNIDTYFDPNYSGTGKTPQGLLHVKEAAQLSKQKLETMAAKASSEAEKARQMQIEAKKLIDEAKKQTEEADAQAKQVLQQARANDAQAQKTLEKGKEALKEAAEACKDDKKCCAIMIVVQGIVTGLEAMKSLTAQEVDFSGIGETDTNAGTVNTLTGQNHGRNGVNNQTEGEKGPCDANIISSRAKEGSLQSIQASIDSENASVQMKFNINRMKHAAQQATEIGKTIGIGMAESTAVAAGIVAAKKCKKIIPKLVELELELSMQNAMELKQKLDAFAAFTQDNVAQEATAKADEASLAAKAQSEYASDQLNKLAIVEENSQEAASFSQGRTIGLVGAYMGLSSLIGNYAGEAYNDALENCQQGFKSKLPVYVTNLTQDKLDIITNITGIEGSWNTEEAKVFGEYESQTVGIIFQNKGIESEKPLYGTVSIKAYKNIYDNPQKIEGGTYAGAGTADTNNPGAATFGPFNVAPKEKQTLDQKYHLKFITAPKTKQEAANSAAGNICLQEAKIGSTGTNALPKVKLDWGWNDEYGISEKTCLEENTDTVYCDAAQFGIMFSKRLKTIQEFVEKNTPMCPKNPSVEAYKKIIEKWNFYLTELGQIVMPSSLEDVNAECWMPKTTSLYDGKPAINYYLEETPNITWTSKIKSTNDLTKYLQFNAYLIKDGYSQGFQKDFAAYYNNQVLLNAPEWFTRSPSGKISDYFSSTNNLGFSQKYFSSTTLPNAGAYSIFLNIDFRNQWKFFTESKTPNALIKTEMNFKKEPEKGSIFYYLPFNANMGTGAARNNYGTSYSNSSMPFQITSGTMNITTQNTTGGVTQLSTNTIDDIKTTNSTFSKRGLLLSIKTTNAKKQLSFYPTVATPIILSMQAEPYEEPISAYFQLRESNEPQKSLENLSFWTGLNNCKSLDQAQITSFNSTPDRYADELKNQDGITDAYAIDWQSSANGKTMLKTIIYSPVTKAYSVGPLKTQGLSFKTTDTAFQSNIELDGISGMPHNNRKTDSRITGLSTALQAVAEGSACITNNRNETTIWWNEEKIESTSGKDNSTSQTEQNPGC